jgi:glutathione S-transferase
MANDTDRRVTLFHAVHSRSFGVRILAEELGADIDLQVLDLKAGDSRTPEYLAINPMGKVPTLRHGSAVVTEQPAIYQYLAELYPQAGLSPAPGDPLRGPYLRWLAFYGSCFEPALLDIALKREVPPRSTAGYGDAQTVLATVERQLQGGPWLLGERYTAADVLWGQGLAWTVGFKLVPATPAVQAYLDRFNARPAVARAHAAEAALVKAPE